MRDEVVPREMPERSGKHVCIRCLAVIPAEEFFANDHICARCAEGDEYPAPERPQPRVPRGKAPSG